MASLRKQYHFRPSKNGYYAWDVDNLIEKSKDLTPIQVKLEDIKELDENFWYNSPGDIPTCRSIVEHMKLVKEADLKYPIILSSDGRIMDGMHRVAKAFLNGNDHISSMKFETDPDPDYVDVWPDDLLY